MDNKEIVGRECRFVFHLPAIDNYRLDTHVVKEKVHYEDGTSENKLRVIENFKREFFTTKEHYRRYEDKKEAEDLNRVNRHTSTQSDLGRAAASRLGNRYIGVRDLRQVRNSPYLYGIDVHSKAIIKHAYMEKYPDVSTKYEVATFDIETDTVKDEVIVISLSMNDKIYTVINKSLLNIKLSTVTDSDKLTEEFSSKLHYMFKKYIPKTDITKNIDVEYIVVDNEMETVRAVMKKAHEWQPDFIAIWNIDYDIPKIMDVCKKYDVDPKDIFTDPSLPKELRYFKYKEGQKSKVTASGVFKPVSPEDQWHTVDCPASFYWIDAMSAHRYIRVGGKTMPGGYSLDNILKSELGSKLAKLKFEDEVDSNTVTGIEWHMFMVANKPLEYIIYNQWDNISMLQLDDKTKDLQIVLPMLSGYSDFGIFNSGPKRIVDAVYFFYLEHGKVLGSKPTKMEVPEGTALSGWIVLLPSYRVKDNGLKCLLENKDKTTNIRGMVFDSDNGI